MKICKKCSKKAKVHVACFKCRNIYHAKCFLRVPTVYVNEKGQMFCCQNLTLKFNDFESKLKIQENESGKYTEKGVYGSDDGLENSRLKQKEYEKDEAICNADSEKKKTLEKVKRHIGLEHRRSEQGEYEKDEAICDTDFETILKKILEEVDRDIADFVCSYCKVKLFEKKSYRQHVKFCKRHHMRQNKTQDVTTQFDNIYKCHICSYTTRHVNGFKEHLTIHSCEKPFKCPYKLCKCIQPLDAPQVEHCDCNMCEFRSASERKLRKHISRKHNNKKKLYKCDHCTYRNHMKCTLRRHALIHLSEKPFKCDTCGFKTFHEKNLSLHILYRHSNMEKRFKCNDCEFSTHRKRSLQIHLNIHAIKT